MMSDFKMIESVELTEGQGARVKRLFPTHNYLHIDPFVLLDEFFVDPPAGFPTHPHSGFEAVTYLLKGAFRHKDNLGNDTVLHPGGVQRFTAGKGIRHSEMPEGNEKSHGFQLWINLPRSKKEIEPSYQQVDNDDIPEKNIEGGKVRTVIGDDSPVVIHTDVLYQDITLSADSDFQIIPEENYKGFIYVFSGSVKIDGESIGSGKAQLIQDVGQIPMQAIDNCRILYLGGKPHNDPIRLMGTSVL
jgi:redox-sensitive bicupin YhaK (pirin superfamily)